MLAQVHLSFFVVARELNGNMIVNLEEPTHVKRHSYI